MSDSNTVDETSPRLAEDETFWHFPDLTGEFYDKVLDRLHKILKPKTYFEIGTLYGATLALSRCASIAVDPKFDLKIPALLDKTELHFYQQTSDDFFGSNSPSSIFGRPIDFAFLDGMHLFEYLLRDFLHTEAHCKNNSIICMHDCMPTDSYVGRRDGNDRKWMETSSHPEWWAGDVWKTAAILLRFRPDLKIYAFNAPPTGLLAITNLNPSSTVLSDRYFNLLEQYRELSLSDHGENYFTGLNIVDTRETASLQTLSRMFWL
jgi:hypothetical protein